MMMMVMDGDDHDAKLRSLIVTLVNIYMPATQG
jgi:hypothetical protein